jgi:ethanolamine permease
VHISGGFYGYARCAIGPFWGYLCGCSGLIESIFYLSVSILKLGQAVSITFQISSNYEPIWWMISFLLILTFHIQGGSLYWKFMSICTLGTFLILGIYLLGSMHHLKFEKYIYNEGQSTGFDGSIYDIFSMLRLPGWFFLGIDLLSLSATEVKDVSYMLEPVYIYNLYSLCEIYCANFCL